MNALMGWALAVAAVAVGYVGWGWRGVVLAVTATVFWLLLQWSRAMRALRLAAANPKGRVPSAVMLHAKLSPGMRLLQLLPLTRSLGEALPAQDGSEVFRWTDEAGASVTVTLHNGRVTGWQLTRPGEDEPAAPAA
jgi:hypothetical protein